MRHIGTQEQQEDVEVIEWAAKPAAVQEIQSWEDLVDGDEGGVPHKESDQAEENDGSQQDIDGTIGHAYHLKYQLANHFTLNQLGNPVLITQHARANEAAEFVLQERWQVEVGQVEAGSGHEGQEEETTQEKHANKEVWTLFALHVSLQQRVLKVALLLGPAIRREEAQYSVLPHVHAATHFQLGASQHSTTAFCF